MMLEPFAHRCLKIVKITYKILSHGCTPLPEAGHLAHQLLQGGPLAMADQLLLE